jgi:hypothetical protein
MAKRRWRINLARLRYRNPWARKILDKSDRSNHVGVLHLFNTMKIKNFFIVTLIVFCASVGWSPAAPIDQTIATINADAQKPGGPDRALKSISASTRVPVATLAKEKASSGLSYGDLYAAHAIANAAGKNFDEVIKLKTKGKTWEKVADESNVSLDGKKKVVKKTAPMVTPKPTSKAQMPPSPDTSNNYKVGR